MTLFKIERRLKERLHKAEGHERRMFAAFSAGIRDRSRSAKSNIPLAANWLHACKIADCLWHRLQKIQLRIARLQRRRVVDNATPPIARQLTWEEVRGWPN